MQLLGRPACARGRCRQRQGWAGLRMGEGRGWGGQSCGPPRPRGRAHGAGLTAITREIERDVVTGRPHPARSAAGLRANLACSSRDPEMKPQLLPEGVGHSSQTTSSWETPRGLSSSCEHGVWRRRPSSPDILIHREPAPPPNPGPQSPPDSC